MDKTKLLFPLSFSQLYGNKFREGEVGEGLFGVGGLRWNVSVVGLGLRVWGVLEADYPKTLQR